MGFKKFLGRQVDQYRADAAAFKRGCQIIGPPSNPRSVLERAERMRIGREAFRREAEEEAGHNGGWLDAEHGFIDSQKVTFALGWGTKEGEVLLADGHVDASDRGTSSFWKSGGHNQYGKGQGSNANVKDRGLYSGPGA